MSRFYKKKETHPLTFSLFLVIHRSSNRPPPPSSLPLAAFCPLSDPLPPPPLSLALPAHAPHTQILTTQTKELAALINLQRDERVDVTILESGLVTERRGELVGRDVAGGR